MRQVTHALLTRPPLSHKIFISEENQIKRFVRLACVRHAASVHPEPGSNSHKKFFPASPSLTSPSLRMDSLKSGLSGLLFLGCIFQCLFSWIFCQPPLLLAGFSAYSSGNSFESFKVIPLFSCQGCLLSLLRDNFYILSQSFAFVNNFLKLF